MARVAKKKDVYKLIEMKLEEILETERKLQMLNEELQSLNAEKDKLEMEQLFNTLHQKGMSIQQALDLLNSNQ